MQFNLTLRDVAALRCLFTKTNRLPASLRPPSRTITVLWTKSVQNTAARGRPNLMLSLALSSFACLPQFVVYRQRREQEGSQLFRRPANPRPDHVHRGHCDVTSCSRCMFCTEQDFFVPNKGEYLTQVLLKTT